MPVTVKKTTFLFILSNSELLNLYLHSKEKYTQAQHTKQRSEHSRNPNTAFTIAELNWILG